MAMTRRLCLVLASIAAATFVASPAHEVSAQDALGGGNALDQNPRIGSGGHNTGQPLNPYAGRNRIITGEVLGGREFRGRVGYGAPNDFRGAVGSNDIYRFQRDSAWSSPSALSLGTTTYDQLRFGQGLGTFALPRPTEGASPTAVGLQPAGSFAQEAQSRWQFDNVTLSALSAAAQQRQIAPSTLRTALTQEGQAFAITSSSLRGLTLEQYDQELRDLGLTPYDELRAREELDLMPEVPAMPPNIKAPRGVVPDPGEQEKEQEKDAAAEATDGRRRAGTIFETRFDDLRSDTRAADTIARSNRVEGTPESEYAAILQRMVDRYALSNDDRITQMQPALEAELKREYDRLREELAGRARPQKIDPATGLPVREEPLTGAPSSSSIPGTTGSSADPGGPGTPDPRDLPERSDRPDEDTPPTTRDPLSGELITPPKDEEDDATKPFDLSKLGPILQHGQKLERLSSEEQGRFNELMTDAEDRLRKGEFMAAEQRFQRALRFTPNHPLAMAGAVNAQIGAEYYLAAALTLRMLFTDHPEMIDTTYDESLLPRERLDVAVMGVRQRLESPADREAYAFLLAYLGRQLGDRAIMQEGIDGMAQDDPLTGLLRTVWLKTDKATTAPQTPEK
jgi:hypothetical protein